MGHHVAARRLRRPPVRGVGHRLLGVSSPTRAGQFIELIVDAPDRIFQTLWLTDGHNVR
jgi:hypothetical protein